MASMELVRAAPSLAGPEPTRSGSRWPVVVLLVLASLLFVGYGGRTIAAPFGDSHDGRNAGVWAAGSRSIRDQGPVRSRLGGDSPENGVYAHHPPLLFVETAIAETVGGGSPAASRAPAWLGSLAVVALLGALLTVRGFRLAAAGAAVALVVATPMFLVYGTMLDTPVTSLPFGLGLLLVWERARQGRRTHPAAAAVLSALAVLAGWQALLVAAVVGGWALTRLALGRGRRTLNVAFAGGALAGAVALLAWFWWATGGSLGVLSEQLRVRTGQGGAPGSLLDLLRNQRQVVVTMFGAVVVLLALPGLVVALAGRRTRALAVVSLMVTVPYTLALRDGTLNHDYWNFWFVLPLAVGLAAGADRILALRPPAGPGAALAAGAGVLGSVLAIGTVARPPAAAWAIHSGVSAGSVAGRAHLGPGQESAWYAGAVGQPATWWGYAMRKPAVKVPADELELLAADRPDDVVMFGELRCIGGEPKVSYGVESARELALEPPVVSRCPAQPSG